VPLPSWHRYWIGSSAGELLPELARHGIQQLIELEATAVVVAVRHESSEERTNYLNGYRLRRMTTQRPRSEAGRVVWP
jgi:putative transposase